MSERWASDIEEIIDHVIEPDTAGECFEEEFYQNSGGVRLPEGMSRTKTRLAAVLLLLFYEKGGWLVDTSVEDLLKKKIGVL